MHLDQFHELYNRKSEQLLGVPAQSAEIMESYKNYLALVDFTGSQGRLTFSKLNGQLVVDFTPIWSK